MQIDKIVVLASALIKNSEGKYLLLKRSNKSTYANHWQFIEGKLEEQENPIKALKREIIEETGTTITKQKLISTQHGVIDAKGKQYLALRIIFEVKLGSSTIKLSDEHTDFGWFTEKQIKKIDLLPGVKEILNREV